MENKYPLSVSDLIGFIDAAYSKWAEKWKRAEVNEKMWLGDNYTEEQKQEIRNQGRQPYSIALAKSKVDRIIGAFLSQRMEYKISAASDPNDEIKAILAQMQVHSVERRSSFQDLERGVFESAMGMLIGVSKMELDYSHIYPRVKASRIDYKNFMYDPNSKSYDISEDALWCVEIDKQYRKLINKKYKIKPEEIKTMATGNALGFEGRDKINYYITPNNLSDDYDVLTIYNFYLKVPKTIYCVIFPDTEGLTDAGGIIDSKWDSESEAEERLRELQIPYILNGLPLEGTVEEKETIGIDRYLFNYERILEYESTDLEKFPYDVCFAVKWEDKFISYLEILKDPQKFYNRFLMEIDKALGKDNKTASQLNVDALSESETEETALQKIESGDTILARSGEDVLKYIENKGANPQWLQMLDVITMIMQDLSGGEWWNSKAKAGDSGTKVNSLIAQGSLLTKPFLDNAQIWRRLVGKNILWWLQHYESAKDVIKVQGGALTPEMLKILQNEGLYKPSKITYGEGFLTVNDEEIGLSYLKDADFELVVTEQALSETEKQGKLALAIQQEQIDQSLMLSPAWREHKLQLSDVPPDVRQKIMAEIQAAQQAVQAQQQQKNEMEQQRINTEKARVLTNAQPGTFAGA